MSTERGAAASTSALTWGGSPGGGGLRRRRRVLFSREQTATLEEWFGRRCYVTPEDRDRLAASLALRPAQVRDANKRL